MTGLGQMGHNREPEDSPTDTPTVIQHIISFGSKVQQLDIRISY
jgi:hypothetical protein